MELCCPPQEKKGDREQGDFPERRETREPGTGQPIIGIGQVVWLCSLHPSEKWVPGAPHGVLQGFIQALWLWVAGPACVAIEPCLPLDLRPHKCHQTTGS